MTSLFLTVINKAIIVVTQEYYYCMSFSVLLLEGLSYGLQVRLNLSKRTLPLIGAVSQTKQPNIADNNTDFTLLDYLFNTSFCIYLYI